jgi:hypothetical protein
MNTSMQSTFNMTYYASYLTTVYRNKDCQTAMYKFHRHHPSC